MNKRRVKNAIKRMMFSTHKLGTRFGVHVLPVHYYSPVPDIIQLEKSQELWAKKSEMPGIDADIDRQVDNLKAICAPYQDEYQGNEAYRYATERGFGPGFGYIEAQALHGVIRHYKPKRVIEVGSGVSTWCMLTALKINQEETGEDYSLTCIEPFPSKKLKSLPEINLKESIVQTVSFEDGFSDLGENDLLFIDSSHAVKPGSDVNHLILEIMPRLKPGVIVHLHDIYLPYDYSQNVLQTFLHWAETALLRAFLTHNHKAKIIFCQSQLHHERKDAMKEVFPEYNPINEVNGLRSDKYKPFESPKNEHSPVSIYIQIQ